MKKATLMALAGALTMATATVNAETKSVKADACMEVKDGKCVKTKATEGKCGEGKCGATSSEPKATEGKCGEGKCGATAPKAAEGKCGEGKCGASK
ncbi:TPA: hypothetical protein PXF07_002653 [Mannheimia haemolytica]|uniref:Uncharacterized low-complexity protein n=2 Tax=Mannheimia haemolytica TaxID=75985 RepID=A0A248ZZX4_MANHA|nr:MULTISPECIES: hypothetical protein [Mannheimia]AWW71166.1 hypothetical protein C4O86_04900 [Pasteurellaceae bacterium 12565]AGI32695.1 hypothetical protein D650_14260 [Mannheimia haemolytica USDA-ARS-USMARC-183]AGI35588.1 hypothetical protein D648_15840 [Mannheimia haemolytica USDA-ARS-USMARC-185]AGK02853.1 hypothetical protein MHH_c24150 [Mannheimia haemolytica M42548]AGQ24960.1 hypothetical protein F382_02790 [Mannheimia haemolytica D153]